MMNKHLNHFCFHIAFLVVSIDGICQNYFQSSSQSTEKTVSIDTRAPYGFQQCARDCINLEHCGSIQFDSLKLTCDLKAGIALCPDASPDEMRCLSKADIQQNMPGVFGSPTCSPFYRSVLLSSGSTACLSALNTIFDKTIELYHKETFKKLTVKTYSTFAVSPSVWFRNAYVIWCGNSTSDTTFMMWGTLQLDRFNGAPHNYNDQHWYVTHNQDGTVTMENAKTAMCLRVHNDKITPANCTTFPQTDISWYIDLV